MHYIVQYYIQMILTLGEKREQELKATAIKY